MQNSLLSTRSFLRKSFHRRQKSTESQASSKVDTPSAAPEWKEERRPSHDPIVEKELAIVQDPDEPSTPRRSDETMKAMVKADTIFKGLPDCSLGMDRYGSFMDDENLKVFGITMDDTASIKGSGRRGQKIGITMTPPMESTVDGTFEMDVPVYAGRDRRPDLQVSIPTKRTPPSRSPQQGKRQAVNTPSSTMSTPSTLKTGQTNKSLGMTSTPISIVSPLSVVEMPKPKRPFSTVSIEGMANGGRSSNTLAPQVKSADSMSSDDTGDMGGKSSGLSARSSMSSVDSDIEVFQALEVRRPSKDSSTQRFDSTSLYHASLAPISPKYPRGNFPPKPFAKPVVQRQGSYSSLRTTSTINVNKPLPPEPGRSGSIPDNRSLFGGGSQTPSRSSSITIRQPMFPRRTGAEHQSSPSIASIQRRDSKGSISKFSLNSKYTPKDLDALDEAFSQHRPSAGSHPLAYSVRSTPSQSQVSLVIENGQLGTITEHTIHNSRNGPVQISRGPMRMEPSRRPPLPPTQVHRIDLPAGDKPEQRKRSIIPRSQSSNHLNAQVKDNAFNPKRSITVGSGSSKAHRILGQSNLSTSISHEVPKVPDPIRKVTDTSQDISRSSSPASSRGGDHTPELEGRADVHVEEIRRRLELLRPTEDPSATFLAVHQLNAARSAEKLRLEEKLMQAEPFKNEINMPAHIAELEAYRTPSPVELPASLATPPAELGLPSPLPTAEIPIPPEPSEGTGRRGRVTNSSTQSTVSGKFHSLHSQRSYKARSLASLAASEIPDIYADLPTSNSSLRPSMTAEEVEQLISADAAERVLLHILESLDNLEDLFAASMVSRGFYRTFKRHELDLLKRAVWRMSPAAWELREMSAPCSGIDEGSYQYTPNLYFRHYVQDLLTMVELKAMILDHCRSFLRPKTISGLAGETERSPMIDEAFWRVWTFCSIFGCGKNREDDIVGQMDWLRGGLLAKQSTDTRTLALTDQLARNSVLFNPPPGFAKGNGKGLTAEELYDMNEIWICLGVLVRGYQGKRKEAREYGIFDNAGIPAGDAVKEDAILEEWTYHILTLAPPTVLDVTSPATPTQSSFVQAQAQGYTSWRPPTQGSSRSTFLKEAVSRVYEEKIAVARPLLQSSPKSFSNLPQVGNSMDSPNLNQAPRQRIEALRAELRAKKQDPSYKDVPVSLDRPLSNYKDVLDRLEAISASSADTPPMPKLPGLAARLSRRMPNVTVTSPTKSTVSIDSPIPKVVLSDASITSPTTGVASTITAPPVPVGRVSNSSPKQMSSPAPSQMSSPLIKQVPTSSPNRKAASRLRSLRDQVTGRPSDPARNDKAKDRPSRPCTPPPASQEKFVVSSNLQPRKIVPSGPQVKDPVDLAVESLVSMGFDEAKAKKALAETDSGNSINFKSALERLKKERDRAKRLERLDRMG